MSIRLKSAYIIVLLTFAWLSASAGNTIIKAKLDSAVLLMGKVTAIHVDISQDKDAVGYFVGLDRDTLCNFVEIAALPAADTSSIDNGRIQIKKDIVLQSFDSGVYQLPPLKYVVGKDTFRTQRMALKVLPVVVDSLKTVHDFKPVEVPPFKIYDWLPDFITDYWWIYVLILLLCALAIGGYILYKKRGKLPFIAKKPEIPPYEEAIMNLNSLKERKLWQNGQEKQYYTELTDILRRYIDRRFGINAVEMTSSQIVKVLRTHEETKASNHYINQVLEIADFVKFAGFRPLSDDNEMSFTRAMNFVEETKPVVVVPETPETPADNGKEVKHD